MKKILFGLFVVFSVLVKAQVPPNVNSGNPNFPFPQFLDYGTNMKSLASQNAPGVTHAEMEQRMRDAWRMVCNNSAYYENVAVDGVRYIYPNPDAPIQHCTCVEGDGYYLLGAALMGDKNYFDGYYMWAHDRAFQGVRRFIDGQYTTQNYNYSKGLSGAGVLGSPTGVYGSVSNNSATDGDVDMAMALLMAYMQWGENSGIQTAIGELNYKEEALKYIQAMVDTVRFQPAQPELKYVTGVIGMDGYLKNGDSWAELTRWGSTNGYQGLPNQNGGGTMVYFDYNAPGYFRQFRHFLENNNGTDWQINQYKRGEASADWLMGQLYNSGPRAIPICGHVEVGASDTQFQFSSTGTYAEDMRAGWRTILNYMWHGNPDITWDPVTHEALPGTNSYEHDMAQRYAQFLANPQGAPWNNNCNAIGDMGLNFWGPYTLRDVMDINGQIGAGFPLNWIHGAGSPAAIVSQDFELMGQMFRHCTMVWDGNGYLDSQPRYFHEWYKLLGMLVLSGNFHAPENMIPKANVKVYHKIDKTYAFSGDNITFTINIRNYGSVDALGTVVKFGIPDGFTYTSASKAITIEGDSIVWNRGTLSGFKTSTGIQPTVDSIELNFRINNDIAQGRYCTSASVACTNGFDWVSDEYPNNKTAVMERNCIDVVARALQITKTVDRQKINPDNIAQFTIDFENSAKAGWINGGRPGVQLSFSHSYSAGGNPSNMAQINFFYRLFHDADEAYIDYGNYRVSYYMYDPSLNCFTGDGGCGVGWNMASDYYQGGNAGSLNISHENTVEGSDANGRWNQRIIVQFSNQLAAPTQHLQQYSGVPMMIHEGGMATLLLNMRMSTSNYNSVDFTDDWSWDNDWYTDEQNDLHSPITADYTDPNNLGRPVESWDRHSCGTPEHYVDRILVEEFDGYTWRRILGNGPMPGRDVYNVELRDTLPAGMEFIEFTNSCPLEDFGATWTTDRTPDGRDIIIWTIDRMMINQGGSIKYNANITFPSGSSCETNDEDIINEAWIFGDRESPVNDTTIITVTCARVPDPIVPTTLTKTSDKENYLVGEPIIYTIEYEQTQGSISDNAESNSSDWLVTPNGSWNFGSSNMSTVSNQVGTARFNYSEGTNYYLSMTTDPATYATYQIILREGSSAPISVEIKPDLSQNILFVTTYQNGVARGSTQTIIFQGSSPYILRLDLSDDLLRMWVNKDTSSGPMYTIQGLTIAEGYVALRNGNMSGGDSYGVHSFSSIHLHTNYAYNVSIYDPIPSEVNFVNANNGGTLINNAVRWDISSGLGNPIPYGTKQTYRWEGEIITCRDYIENVVYADIMGHPDSSFRARNIARCGTTCTSPSSIGISATLSTVCENQQSEISITTVPSGSWRYSIVGDTTIYFTNQLPISLSAGSYTAIVADIADTVACALEQDFEIALNPGPALSITVGDVCTGNEVDITLSHPTGTFTSTPNAMVGGAFIPQTDGTYTLSLTADSVGCSNTVELDVIATTASRPSLVEDTLVVVSGESVPNFEVFGIASGTLTWYEGSSIVGTGSTFTSPETANGIYRYTVTRTQNGCESEPATAILIITNCPVLPPAVSEDTVCAGEYTNYILRHEGTNAFWFNTGSIIEIGNEVSSAVNYSISLAGLGMHEMLVAEYDATNNCLSEPASAYVFVSDTALPNITASSTFCSSDNSNSINLTPTGGILAVDGTMVTEFIPANYSAGNHTLTYRAQNSSGCWGEDREIVEVLQTPTPVTQTTITLKEFELSSNPNLEASGAGTIYWLTATGSARGTGTTIPHGITTAGNYVFYVYQVINGCASDTLEINISVTSCDVQAPFVDLTSQIVCDGEQASTYNATADPLASAVNWYDAAGNLVETGSAFTPDLLTPGSYMWTVTQTVGCEGLPATVSLTVRNNPLAVLQLPALCLGSGLGTAIVSPVGGNLFIDNQPQSGTTFSLDATTLSEGNHVFRYEYTDIYGCTDDTIINAQAILTDAPVAPSLVEFIDDAQFVLQATATGNIVWLNTDGTQAGTGPVLPVPTSTIAVVYQYEVYSVENGCESERVDVTYEVSTCNVSPPTLAVVPNAVCQGEPASTAVVNTETGITYNWYQFGSTSLETTGSSFSPGNLPHGTYIYTVTANGSCESGGTPVIFEVKEVYAVALTSVTQACEGVSIYVNADAGPGILEWTEDTLGSTSQFGLSFQISPTGGENNLFVRRNYNACNGPWANASFTATPKPATPSITDGIACQGNNAILGATPSAGGTIFWYSTPSLTNPIGSGNTYSAQYTTTFYATQRVNGCESDATSVTSTIISIPLPPVTTSNYFCDGSATTSILAQPAGVADIRWYSSIDTTSSFRASGNLFTPTVEGTYYAVAWANGCGSSPIATQLEKVTPPIVTIMNATPATLCNGYSKQLRATGTGVDSVVWFVNSLEEQRYNLNYIFQPSSIGNYTIEVQSYDRGCVGLLATTQIAVQDAPSAPTITGLNAGCEGDTPPTLSVTPQAGLDIEWSLDNDVIGSDFTLSGISYQHLITSGTYEIEASLIIQGSGCRSLPSLHTLTIASEPRRPIIPEHKVCLGQDTALTFLGNSGYTYNWFNSTLLENVTNTENNGTRLEVSATDVGTTIYTIEPALGNCTGQKANVSFTVWPLPTVEIMGDSTVCSAAQAPSTFVGRGNYTTINMKPLSNEVVLSVSSTPDLLSATFNSAGIFKLAAVAENEYGCFNYDTLEVIAAPAIKVDMEAEVFDEGENVQIHNNSYWNDTLIYKGDTVTYGYTWTWFNDATFEEVEDSTSLYILSLPPGEHTVSLTVESATYGCSGYDEEKVKVDISSGLWVPNAFAPESNSPGVSIFQPKGHNLKKCQLYIYDTWGNLVFYGDEIEDGMFISFWNGYSNGKPLKADVYIWKIEAEFIDGSEWKGQKDKHGNLINWGNITLIR